jgi:hypothetical protein
MVGTKVEVNNNKFLNMEIGITDTKTRIIGTRKVLLSLIRNHLPSNSIPEHPKNINQNNTRINNKYSLELIVLNQIKLITEVGLLMGMGEKIQHILAAVEVKIINLSCFLDY